MNQFELAVSVHGLHNQDLIIKQVCKCSPTTLLLLPVRQRTVEMQNEREKEDSEMKWGGEVLCPCHTPSIQPAESLESWSLMAYRCRNLSRVCAFNLASKSSDQNKSIYSFVSDLQTRQGELELVFHSCSYESTQRCELHTAFRNRTSSGGFLKHAEWVKYIFLSQPIKLC